MIKVNYNLQKNFINISGHANSDDYGKDVVCAFVSGSVYAIVNGVLNISDSAIDFIDKEDRKSVV